MGGIAAGKYNAAGQYKWAGPDYHLLRERRRKFMENTASSRRRRPAGFTVRQLSPALGAEILGVDLRDPIDDALKQKLLDTWHEHLVILLRNQSLEEDSQVRFAATFGPPAKITSG